MAVDKRELLLVVKGKDDGASKALGGVAVAADKAEDKLDGMQGGLRKLDGQIDETKGTIAALNKKIAETGDFELFKDLDKATARLRQFSRRRDGLLAAITPPDPEVKQVGVRIGTKLAEGLITTLSRSPKVKLGDKIGDDDSALKTGLRWGGKAIDGILSATAAGAKGISSVLEGGFGALPAPIKAGVTAAIVAGAVAGSAFLGATIAGAVIGGVGIGGVAGGLMIAARHQDVKAAATLTGATLSKSLERAGVSFVPVAVQSLGLIRTEIGGMEDDFRRVFSKASTWVMPLTRGATGFAREILPGIEAIVSKGGPVIEQIASWGPKLGRSLTDVFGRLSEDSYTAARALAALWLVMDFGIRTTGVLVSGLTKTYGALEKLSLLLTHNYAALIALQIGEKQAEESGGDLTTGLQELLKGFEGAGEAAAGATQEIETLTQMTKRLTDDNLSAEQAQMRLEEAIDAGTEAGKRSSAGISTHTAAGRENRKALLDIATAARDSSAAILTQTGSQALAEAATVKGRDAFIKSAMAMGASKKEAIALADKLFAIPSVAPTVKVDKKQADAAITALNRRIADIDRRIDIKAVMTTSYGGSAHTGQGYSTGYSAGGPVSGTGPKGVDSKPAMLAPGEHVWTAREVDAMGGQAAVSRLRKSVLAGGRASASYASASWSGGGGGGNSYSISVTVAAGVSPAEVGRATVQAIQAYERGSGKGWRSS